MINDLVTVGVITYNQENTIVELLDSVYQQTYRNIEIVVSDDCSSDNTVEIVRNWLKCHSDRFFRTELICSELNQGISANLNKNLKAAKGKWFKPIGGDDVLLPTCIQDFMNYYEIHPDSFFMVGKFIGFGANQRYVNSIYEHFNPKYYELSSDKQLNLLVFGSFMFLPSCAAIYNRLEILKKEIIYDERIPMLEDLPFLINVLKKGVKIYFIDKDVVMYRLNGISNQSRDSLRYYESGRLLRYYYQFPEWSKRDYDDAVQTMVREECEVYSEILRLERTKAYRIGKFILKPYFMVKKILFGR